MQPGQTATTDTRWHLAQHGAGLAWWSLDLRTGAAEWSPQLYELLKLPADIEPSVQTWMSLVHEDDRAALDDKLRQVVDSSADTFSAEFRVVLGSGVRWLMSMARIERDPRGRATTLVGIHVDVTARRETEDALRASEARFRTVVDHANAGLVQADTTGRMTLVNERWCQMIGYSEAELLSMTIDEVTHARSREATRGALARLWHGGPDFVIDKAYCRKDGSILTASTSVSAYRDAAGRFLGSVAVILDLDDRTRAAEALRRSQEQLASVSNAVPALISYVDAGYRYQFVNRTYTEWFGVSAGEIVGRPVREVLGEAAWRAVESHMVAAMHGQTADFETEAHYSRGGSRWIHAIYTPDRDSQGNVAGIVIMVSDISARKRAEEALREADRRKDEFLAILAHELRNPLAPIRTGLELLRLSGNQPAALERIRPVLERQVAHMVRLIDDLLDVSRITSGKIQLQRQPTPLEELVRTAIDANRSAIESAGLTIAVELPATPCLLDVDPTRFVQVLSNLLHNAAKFTERGGHITMSARFAEDHDRPVLCLSVRDTGVGITGDMLPRVFELFVQGPDRGGSSGLGIGLALARQLVELHGGELAAESEGPGRGSVFTVRMPALTWTALPEEASVEDSRRPQLEGRVLVIDDNRDAAETLAALLESIGARVETANDGEGGLRRAAELQPHVVLLDIGMPGMDGYQTCRRLRQQPFARDCYVVALTGWGQEHDRERALAEGFDAHVTKPAEPRTLARLLARALSRQSDGR